MIRALGYPLSLLTVEKELSHLPHIALNQQKIPQRRADILCFAKGIHPSYELYPLLLLECKAASLNHKGIRQVEGYNHFVQAYFVAIANQSDVSTGWYDGEKKQYIYVPFLPSYQDLLQSVLARDVSSNA